MWLLGVCDRETSSRVLMNFEEKIKDQSSFKSGKPKDFLLRHFYTYKQTNEKKDGN